MIVALHVMTQQSYGDIVSSFKDQLGWQQSTKEKKNISAWIKHQKFKFKDTPLQDVMVGVGVEGHWGHKKKLATVNGHNTIIIIYCHAIKKNFYIIQDTV